MSKSISIVYHSGYGHTAKVAEAVAEGARQVKDSVVHVIKADAVSDADWDTLDQSDAIIFGAPTYMGGPSAPFKAFADASSKKWFAQTWKDKIAAGFTNSASYSGDKLASLQQLHILAMQHGMIWVGLGLPALEFKAGDMPDGDKLNRIGSFSGLMTQSNHKEGPDTAPPAGDLQSAQLFGKRVAEITARFRHPDKDV